MPQLADGAKIIGFSGDLRGFTVKNVHIFHANKRIPNHRKFDMLMSASLNFRNFNSGGAHH